MGVIARWRDRLPVGPATPELTLGEGDTPLVRAERLSERLGVELYFKFEGANPTGSFKDRGMTVAISKAVEDGAEAVICASTGNTSASAAAYAVKAGLRCVVAIPSGKIAMGKLAQAVVHGATLLQVDGGFDQCLQVVRELAASYPVVLVNSVNPFRLEGQKTAAFEVVDALGEAPDVHVMPVGNAGNISAYWKGYDEYANEGVSSVRPRMWGVQAEGAAPLVLGAPVEHPETIATAIRVGNPASWKLAEAACADSGGLVRAVSDEQILAAQQFLAEREGVFVEPASAAGVAYLRAEAETGRLDRDLRIVVTVTGHGLKDTETALRSREISTLVVPPTVEAAAEVLGLS
jgi:threonine synthase